MEGRGRGLIMILSGIYMEEHGVEPRKPRTQDHRRITGGRRKLRNKQINILYTNLIREHFHHPPHQLLMMEARTFSETVEVYFILRRLATQNCCSKCVLRTPEHGVSLKFPFLYILAC
jgi:hypothetical protein